MRIEQSEVFDKVLVTKFRVFLTKGGGRVKKGISRKKITPLF